jgi:hypothetical protein
MHKKTFDDVISNFLIFSSLVPISQQTKIVQKTTNLSLIKNPIGT